MIILRNIGKEKDEESGLYYHGARYYACWLGRWTAADPIGIGDGLNVYMYVHGNPVSGVDPSGTQTVDDDLVKSVVNGDDASYDFKGVFVKGSADVSLNESEETVNEIKKEIAAEDAKLFEKWFKEILNETIDQSIDTEKESPFDFDDVGKKIFDSIQKTNYAPLKEMIRKIKFLAKEKIKSAPVDNPNENPYFDMASNTIRYNPNQEMYGNYIDQFVHELTHTLQKLEGRFKSHPIPISLEVEAFQMQFESMEYDGRFLMGSRIIKENYSVFKANRENLKNYGTWLFRRIYDSQNTLNGKSVGKYNNDYVE